MQSSASVLLSSCLRSGRFRAGTRHERLRLAEEGYEIVVALALSGFFSSARSRSSASRAACASPSRWCAIANTAKSDAVGPLRIAARRSIVVMAPRYAPVRVLGHAKRFQQRRIPRNELRGGIAHRSARDWASGKAFGVLSIPRGLVQIKGAVTG